MADNSAAIMAYYKNRREPSERMEPVPVPRDITDRMTLFVDMGAFFEEIEVAEFDVHPDFTTVTRGSYARGYIKKDFSSRRGTRRLTSQEVKYDRRIPLPNHTHFQMATIDHKAFDQGRVYQLKQ